MKKVISILLAAVLMFSAVITANGAEQPERVYHYVALGDSIAAGYGLDSEKFFTDDPALFISEERIADPVRGAYPALFGDRIAEWGQQYDCDVTATNLAACAYLAGDVERTILEEGYKSTVLDWLFKSLGAGSGANPLDQYHDIFVKYLEQADLVSIQLGGNDIIMGVVLPMTYGSNPILQALGTSILLILLGMDAQTSLGAALMVLNNAKDSINYKTFYEAIRYMAQFEEKTRECVDQGAEGVGRVIDAVRTINSDADQVVVGMFNPYGNSLEYNGKVQNVTTVLGEIVKNSASYLIGSDASDGAKARVEALTAIVMSQLAYPMQYLLAGKSMDDMIRLLNEKLKVIAEEKGVAFVDVYDITNESNLDPHPDAAHHREIADRLEAALKPMVIERMSAIPAVEVILGDADGDGAVTVLDVTAVQRVLANMETKSFDEAAADADEDGQVTILDATEIQRWLAGASTHENIGKPM